jgi:hypothetical protein
MTELSPAAQTVLDAFNGFHDLANRRLKIAAALEAAADQVVPERPLREDDQRWMPELYTRQVCRQKLLAIAAELCGTITKEAL